MSAQELRQAAALIRERAEAATPGPWVQGEAGDPYVGPNDVVDSGKPGERYVICEHAGPDAPHIASWDPTVAVLVADSLDVTAVHIENHDCEAHCEPRGCGLVLSALTLARAYLGSES